MSDGVIPIEIGANQVVRCECGWTYNVSERTTCENVDCDLTIENAKAITTPIVQKESADRYNDGKPRLALNPPVALTEIAKVWTFGAKKYDSFNWYKGLTYTSILDSLERHIQAIKMGEDVDPESGCLHAAHAGCNIMMLLEFISLKRTELDDRPKRFYLTYLRDKQDDTI